MATSQRILNKPDPRLRGIHFKDQLVESLVMHVNDDGLLRVMHVPEDPLSVLIEGARQQIRCP